MTQNELDHAVANITRETVATIRRFGFSLLKPPKRPRKPPKRPRRQQYKTTASA